jgi:hypothetical protein
MKMKAIEIFQKKGIDYKYSKGWLQQFKEGWNITWQSTSREGTSASAEK